MHIFQHLVLENRLHLIVVFALFFIKFVHCIDIMTNMTDGHQSVHMVCQRIIALMHGKLLLAVLCLSQFPDQTGEFLSHFFEVYPFIGHIAEFHRFSPLMARHWTHRPL